MSRSSNRTCGGRLWETEFKQEGQDPTSQVLAYVVWVSELKVKIKH